MSENHQPGRSILTNENENVDEIQYGLRHPRRNTTWIYCDSSSLSPAQIMERDVYLHAAEDSIFASFSILQNITVLSVSYHAIQNLIQSSLTVNPEDLSIINNLHDIFLKLKEALCHLLFLLTWVRSYGEFALLYAEDLSIFVRRQHRFPPRKYQHINDIPRGLCYAWFGCSQHDIQCLYVHWRVPISMHSPSRHVFQGEECFIILLYHLMRGYPFTEMSRNTFGGDHRYLSLMFNAMVEHLYYSFYNKISGTSLNQWIPSQVHLCQKLIHDTFSYSAIEESHFVDGALVDREWIFHHFNFDTFRPFGFIDDFSIPTALETHLIRDKNLHRIFKGPSIQDT